MSPVRKNNGLLFSATLLILGLFCLSGCSSLGIKSIPLERLKAKYGVKDADFIEVNGINIHYKIEGNGPPLVLLHGICASLYTWDGWVEQLKNNYKIIRLDVPGWGLTGSVGNSSVDIEAMVSTLDSFMNTIGIDSFHLAGSSLGGYFAWNYALRHPERVNKMILLDPVSYPQAVPWFINYARIPLLRTFPKFMMPKFLVSMNVKAVYSDDSKITDDIVDLYFDMAMREGNRASYIDIFRFMSINCKKETISTGVKNIKTPTLLMYGADDKWVSATQAQLWEKDLPGVQSIIYEGVGHIPMEELPVRTANDADRFLSDTPKLTRY